MDARAVTGSIRLVPLFTDLTADEIDAIIAISRRHEVPAGTKICQQGSPADAVLIIEAGKARVQVTDAAGKRVEIARLGPGEVAGEMALVDGGPRSADVVALTPLVVARIERDAFMKMSAELHPATFKIMRRIGLTVCGRLRRVQERVAQILGGGAAGSGSAPEPPARSGSIVPRPASTPGATQHRAFLRSLPVLSWFDDAELDMLVRVLAPRELGTGGALFRTNDPGTGCYIVARGKLSLVLERMGKQHDLGELAPGDLVGHLELLDGGRRHSSCRAVAPSTVLELDRSVFDRLLAGRNLLAFKIVGLWTRLAVEQLRLANENLARIAEGDMVLPSHRPVSDPAVQSALRDAAGDSERVRLGSGKVGRIVRL